MRADQPPRFGAFWRVILHLRGRRHGAEMLVEFSRRNGVALSDRSALGFVRLQQPRSTPPLHQRRKLPGEVGGIVHTRVHPEAASRREKMGGIAGERHAASGKPLGDKCDTGGPGPMAMDADWNIGADAPPY